MFLCPSCRARSISLKAKIRSSIFRPIACPNCGALFVVSRLAVLLSLIVAEVLVFIVANNRADLIVMGSHGHTGLKKLLLGSAASTVAVSCTKPLLVVRGAPVPKRDSLRLGIAARDAAGVGPGRPRSLVLVLNQAELSLSNAASRALGAAWARKGVSVRVEELPEAWKLPHDFGDPAQPGARPDEVDPLLEAAILGP